MHFKKQLINILIGLLKERNLEKQDLCEITGLSRSNLDRLMRKYDSSFSFERLAEILTKLGYSVDVIVQKSDEIPGTVLVKYKK